MNKAKIQELILKPLTDTDLERFLGYNTDNHILKYSELGQYNDLEDLLPHHKSYKIILIEYEMNSGHWICMLRYYNVIEIFNSYGNIHDELDFRTSLEMNKYLGQAHLHLNILIEKELKEDKFDIIYNEKQFQKKSLDINTCGRHVVNRIISLLDYNMTLKQYIEFMKKATVSLKLNFDELVAFMIQ
jgi:hypothetical protein